MTLVCGEVGKCALIASTQGPLEPLDAALHADSTLALLCEPQKKEQKVEIHTRLAKVDKFGCSWLSGGVAQLATTTALDVRSRMHP
jgi:hypothetical protein